MPSHRPEAHARTDLGPQPGMSGKAELTVGPADTALTLRSGDVPVLGTPRLIALCDEASCRALDGLVANASTSVASRVQFDHLAPVPVGATVVAEARLTKVEGRRLTFTIFASRVSEPETGMVGAGRLNRVIVDRRTFLSRAGEAESPPSLDSP